jgi:HNH endonuclease
MNRKNLPRHPCEICGSPVHGRSRWCGSTCRMRSWRAHRAMPKQSEAERFWKKVEKTSADGCWEWTASRNRAGYGQFQRSSRIPRLAHLYAYELIVGPVPPKHDLHHVCENRGCCNPAHLEPLTRKEHMEIHLATRCRRGHAYTEGNTYVRPSGGRECRICMAERQRNRRRKEGSS